MTTLSHPITDQRELNYYLYNCMRENEKVGIIKRDFEQEIYKAIYEIDIEKVKQLIYLDPLCVHELSSNGKDSTLMIAIDSCTSKSPEIRKNRFEIARLLLKNKVNINHQNFSGRTALHKAVLDRDVEAVKFLLKEGADSDITDNCGLLAKDYLLVDSRDETNEILTCLVTNKPKKNIFKNELDPQLLQAFKELDIESIKDLVKRGANPYIRINLNFDRNLKRLSLVTDRDLQSIYLIDSIESFSDIENESGRIYSNRFSFFLKKGGYVSDRFIPNIVDLIREVASIVFTDKDLAELDIHGDISLFELAFEIRDLEFIKILFESGYELSELEKEEINFFDAKEFTLATSEIINYILSKGYKMEYLLQEGETFYEVIQEAKEENNTVLLKFLNKHGIEEETIGEELINW